MSLAKIAVLALVALASLPVRAANLPPEIADCRVYKIWRFDQGTVLSLSKDWRPDHNVSPFELKGGVLSFENTGLDPWILNDRIGGPDASKYHFLGIKMRSSKEGQDQIYFGTDKHAGPSEQTIVTHSVTGDGKFHFYEIDMSQAKTWDGKVRVIRIDTANSADEIGAKIDIEWIALYQVPPRITIGRPYSGVDGKGAFVSIPVTNLGGEVSRPSVDVTAAGASQRLKPIKPREVRTVTLRPRASAGPIRFTVSYGGRLVAEGMLAPAGDSNPSSLRVYSSVGELVFHKNAQAYSSAAIAGVDPSDPSRFVRLGEFRPLATVAYRDSNGVLHYNELSPDTIKIDGSPALLHCDLAVPGGPATVDWAVELPSKDSPEGRITCDLVSDVPLDILRFEGPRLLAGEGSFGASKTHGVFPGLEYLEKNEPSSAVKHIGPKFADRHVPHPYKITVPLMAVEADGAVVGLSWDPMAEWASGQKLPCAEFESPSRSMGAKNHLMTVFIPSIPECVPENAEFAKTPLQLKPGEKITLSTSFFARPGRKITDVIPDYYASHGLIKSPPVAHGLDGSIDLCFRAYTESLYSAEKNGWKNHFGLGQTHGPNNTFAARILAESLRKTDPELARKCKIDPNAQLVQYVGTTLDWFAPGSENWAKDTVAKQSKDGGFPYDLTPDVAKRVKEIGPIGGSKETSLGDIGKTNSGLTARCLTGLLDYAVRTGKKQYIDAGLKGLDRMNQFTVPRGAQTWEVHAHAPDIYAAGLAVDANIKGYNLTGDEKYLERAKLWACTGLPFIYSWVPPIDLAPKAVFHADEMGEGKKYVYSDPAGFFIDPARQINAGATIPVLGTTYFAISWFGNVVQWCGAAWADAVQHLLRLRPDPVLKAAADAVFASCTQQQFDKGWAAGTYPDSWTLTTNTTNAAFICPDVIYEYAYGLIGEKNPTATDTAGFDLKGRRARLNSYGRIERFKSDSGRLEADLKFYAGQDLYTCIVSVPKPTGVRADGVDLGEQADLRTATSGFYYDAANEALHVKSRPASRISRLAVAW